MASSTLYTDPRLAVQRPASRSTALATPTGRALGRSRSQARASLRVRTAQRMLPSWVVFTTIFLTLSALCVTVTLRTHAARQAAMQRYEEQSQQVEQMRQATTLLQQQVKRVEKDPVLIERTARERLNMVRPNEIVVPVKR